MIFPFGSMAERVREKIDRGEPGLYKAVLFPVAFGFTVTFTLARLFNHAWPFLYFQLRSGLHIHHFTYGVFLIAIAGYLGLVFNGPRAKVLIATLLGVGLGFAFDEFSIWLRLNASMQERWSYEGLVVVIGLFILTLSIAPGVRFIRKHWRF